MQDTRLLVVLDDDPTGVQDAAGVSVALAWDAATLRAALHDGDRALHIVTNSRAGDGAEAARLTASAAAAAQAMDADARIVLRGDSTLRAHLLEEYQALCGATNVDGTPPLLLVPALPSAGRVTRDGVQMLVRDGRATPLHETEYARDAALGYSSARLSEWADERSDAYFAAERARTVGLEEIRASGGAERVAEVLDQAWQGRLPAAVVPDAETDRDLGVIADGLRRADPARVVVRCSPAFATALAGTRAATPAPAPSAEGGVLVVCGSYVPTATAQLNELAAAWPGTLVEADVAELAGASGRREVERLAGLCRQSIASGGLAIVASPRGLPPTTNGTALQARVAAGLAEVVRSVEAGVVVAKGGVTSAITARVGLGAAWARVAGPVAPGVSRWDLPDGATLLVVPGNVGSASLLVDIVELIHAHGR